MRSPPRTIYRELKQAELRDMLERYEVLGNDPKFSRACRKIDKLNLQTINKIGDRLDFYDAVVRFYRKWNVYPIPEHLVNDHNFRVPLEQLYLRQRRIYWIPVSPLTSEDEILHYFRVAKEAIKAPKKLPDLPRLRIALIYDHLVVHSAFHAFKAGDFAAAMGSKPKSLKAGRPFSASETRQADRHLQESV